MSCVYIMWEPSEDDLNKLKLDILVILIHFGQTQIYSKRLGFIYYWI